MQSSLLFFLFGRWGGTPTVPVQLIVGFRVLHHELDILHVTEPGEPNGVWQENEEDAGDNNQDEGDGEEAERVQL